MKNSAYLINTAESGIVDEDALYMALVNGGLRGAAIDVPEWELGESYTFDAQRPLYKLDNCVITPVIAAMTEEALSRMIRVCVKEVITVLKGEKPTWIANPSVTTTSGVK
jgi:phosphoglycerate dehydrogenase-like enzyme